MADSREYLEKESIYSGKFLTFPLNRQSFHVWDRETLLAIHVPCSIHYRHLIKDFSLNGSKCHRWNPSAKKYRETCRER